MADAITIQELIDARTDAKTLEEAVNGDAVTTVLSRLGETYPTLSNAISQIDGKLDSADAQIKQAITDLFENGGLPATPFATKALMTASALVDGDYAMVTDDTTNNGLYVKTAGAWVKSAYDPLAQSKTYTDTKTIDKLTAFDTLALLTTSSLANDSYALVAKDNDAAKNGYYQKQSGTWSYLPYNLTTKLKQKNLFNGEYLQALLYGSSAPLYANRVQKNEFKTLVEIKVKPNTTYTFSSPDPSLIDRYRLALFDKKPEYLLGSDAQKADDVLLIATSYAVRTFTTTANTHYFVAYVSSTGKKPRLQLEEGSVATAYEAPTPTATTVIDAIATEPSYNIFNGNLIAAQTISTDGDPAAVYLKKTTGISASYLSVIAVSPNREYTFSSTPDLDKDFKVSLWTSEPTIYEADSVDNGSSATGVLLDTPYTAGENYVTFNTAINTNFVVIEVSNGSMTSKLQLEESSSASVYKAPLVIPSEVLETTETSGGGENGVNLFSGEYKLAVLYGTSVAPRLIMNTDINNGVLAEVKIDKNTTYTISSPDGHLFNRFRVALVNSKPFYGSMTDGTKIDTAIDDSNIYKELTFTTGSQSEYLIVYVSNNTGAKPRLQVEKGSQATPYTEPSNYLENTLTKLTTKKSQNLLDKKYAIPAQITNTDSGLLSISRLDGYPLYHLITMPVESSKSYTLSSDAGFTGINKIYSFAENPLLLLNDGDTVIEDIVGDEITEFDKNEAHQKTFLTLSNTKFIVLELDTGNLTSKLQFEMGGVVSEYKEPYVIASSILETGSTSGNSGAIGKSTNLNNIRPFHILSDIDSLYVTENPLEDFFINPRQLTSADIIQLYDDLVAEFPEYITKEVLGQDPHGYDMVSYTTHPVPRYVSSVQGFDPSNSSNEVLKPPKIVITSAVHGVERAGVYSNYYLIRDMLRGTDNDKALAYLKRNVQFVICPIVNRSGFDDFTYGTRTNGNVNRDFIQGEVSLPESIILKEFLDSHKDMDFYIDFHNSRAITSELGYVFTGEQLFGETSIQIFQELGVVWQEREPRLNQDPRAIWGFSMETIDGMVIGYVSEYLGVPSIIPETKYTLPNVDTGSHYNKDVVRLGKELMVNCIHMCLRESRRVNA